MVQRSFVPHCTVPNKKLTKINEKDLQKETDKHEKPKLMSYITNLNWASYASFVNPELWKHIEQILLHDCICILLIKNKEAPLPRKAQRVRRA